MGRLERGAGSGAPVTVTSLILGIDVSPRRLGWGLVDLVTGEPVACGMEPIDLPDHGWSHDQVARALVNVGRRWVIGEVVTSTSEVQAIYIEQPALPPVSGPKSAYNAGRAVQEAHNACERRWPHAPIEYLMPSSWRKYAGLKGNASKADVMAAALAMVDGPLAQDAADALLIAVAGFHSNEEIMAVAARG
jgi:Holliday junction resolvasome RuvABC endonuclease subunit